MMGFTWVELETNGLMPVGTRANGDAEFYVDMDHHLWQDDLPDTLRLLAKDSSALSEMVIFRRCASSTKRGEEKVFFPLIEFELKNGKFASSLRAKQNLLNVEKALIYKANNLPILRMYMMGDEGEPIVCPWTDHQIDSLIYGSELPFNIWEQHHFKVVGRTSVQKEGSDPGEILRSTDFNVPSPRSRAAIEDMMRTVFLSPTGHKIVHNRWTNSDITNYLNDQLPWALKCESNYDKFVAYLGTLGYDVFPSYSEWIESLKLTASELNF
jgi:hypothetical protein